MHKTIKSIKLIECNQLASNHPIEDRLRIARFNFNDKENPDDETIALAVFDGHGGGSCADVICQRLFHYIAISLMPNPKSFSYETIGNLVENLSLCPNPHDILKHKYDKKAVEFLIDTVSQKERKALETFSNEIKQCDVSDAIINAFQRCDNDLGQEIEQNLLSSPSNILLHYYLSLAVSGCCVTLMLIHKNTAYIASCGKFVSFFHLFCFNQLILL